MNDTVNCLGAATLVCEARDRALTALDEQRLGAHLRTCAECTSAAKQFASLFAQLDTLLAKEPGGTMPPHE